MLKIKCDINQQYLKSVHLHFSNLNNFHSLEVVDRVSETQLQVGENLNGIIWRSKGLYKVDLAMLTFIGSEYINEIPNKKWPWWP